VINQENLDDGQEDQALDLVAGLRTHDVSARRARVLRQRCHAALQPESRPKSSAWRVDEASIRRVIVPALGGAWCFAYLVEIVRYAATSFGYFGSQ